MELGEWRRGTSERNDRRRKREKERKRGLKEREIEKVMEGGKKRRWWVEKAEERGVV